MRTVSQVLIGLSLALTFAGLVPCFGWLNWVAVPLSVACAVVGTVGLATDREPSGAAPSQGIHAAALCVGLVMIVIGSGRCLVGGGIF